MKTVDTIRKGLIDKILTIKDKEVLKALDTLISSNTDYVELTEDQEQLLQLSESDIKYGRLISQDAMNKRNLEWLNEM
nr:hypothetical protein [uncultured Psychroserpens sp.]|tara:strand:- start:193 stop:426 length:234 start_codon:yes stop_codon:yes gene_type:complete